MPPSARWVGLASAILFAAVAIDGLRVGKAWSRTGRDTPRVQQPVSYWLSIVCQASFSGLCLWCSAMAWSGRG